MKVPVLYLGGTHLAERVRQGKEGKAGREATIGPG